MKVGILGYGEIGKSIHQLYLKSSLDSNIFIEDLRLSPFDMEEDKYAKTVSPAPETSTIFLSTFLKCVEEFLVLICIPFSDIVSIIISQFNLSCNFTFNFAVRVTFSNKVLIDLDNFICNCLADFSCLFRGNYIINFISILIYSRESSRKTHCCFF